jgi:hypothetical protein
MRRWTGSRAVRVRPLCSYFRIIAPVDAIEDMILSAAR